ncbi:hypothetical protein FRC03_010331 [Tulasnella sp. 419]|nr:hypothetical protein FRC03_010331 [Tulasnella sp. 419]
MHSTVAQGYKIGHRPKKPPTVLSNHPSVSPFLVEQLLRPICKSRPSEDEVKPQVYYLISSPILLCKKVRTTTSKPSFGTPTYIPFSPLFNTGNTQIARKLGRDVDVGHSPSSRPMGYQHYLAAFGTRTQGGSKEKVYSYSHWTNRTDSLPMTAGKAENPETSEWFSESSDDEDEEDTDISEDLFEFNRFLDTFPDPEVHSEAQSHSEVIDLLENTDPFEYDEFLSYYGEDNTMPSVVSESIASLAVNAGTNEPQAHQAEQVAVHRLSVYEKSKFWNSEGNARAKKYAAQARSISANLYHRPPRAKVTLSAIGTPPEDMCQIQEEDEIEELVYPPGLLSTPEEQAWHVRGSFGPPNIEEANRPSEDSDWMVSSDEEDDFKMVKSYFSPEPSILGDDDDANTRKSDVLKFFNRFIVILASSSFRRKESKGSPALGSGLHLYGEGAQSGASEMHGRPPRTGRKREGISFGRVRRMHARVVSFARTFMT